MVSREQTAAIAIIGATESGKSTFINLASGSDLPTRKSPGSNSTELQSSTFSLDGRSVTLIDTPGFDDNSLSVLGVLKLISEYFSRLSSQGVKFAGVIYMHHVAEDRMGGPSRRNFQALCKFCGDTSLRDVVVVTNGGQSDAKERGSDRRDEFMRAVDKGARMLRHDGSRASAHAILRQIINREPTMPPTRTESPSQPADLVCATATADTMRELTNQVEHHSKTSGKLCQGIDAATLAEDGETKDALQKEAGDSLEKMERIRHDLQRLVTDSATEREGENQQCKNASYAQKTGGELETRPLGEEGRASTLIEAEQCPAETQQRVLRKGGGMGNLEILTLDAGQQYVKRFACVAVIFALVCVSRIVLDGSPTLLL